MHKKRFTTLEGHFVIALSTFHNLMQAFGHREALVSQSPAAFSNALKNISWRARRLRVLKSRSLLWPTVQIGVLAQIDEYMVQCAVSETPFTWNGINRFHTEHLALADTLVQQNLIHFFLLDVVNLQGADAGLQRTKELLGLVRLPRGAHSFQTDPCILT